MIEPKLKLCFGCEQQKHIWKNVKGKKYCKECTYSGKIPDQETVSKVLIKENNFVKLKSIKQVSDKKRLLDAQYTKLRKEFLEKTENSTCYAKLPGTCMGGFKQQLTIHHKNGRLGENYLNTDTWIPLCMSCHHWVEVHPKEAREIGLSETKR